MSRDDQDKIYLHYTRDELDRNFDQRGWIDNAEAVIARYTARSEATRAKFTHRRDVRYGAGADEILDIFPAGQAGAPVCVFVHGGAWRNFTKDDYSFVAGPLVEAGVHAVILNFSKLPKARMPEVVAQVRRGIAWTYRNAESFGGGPRQLLLAGHSSGAHLSAAALTTAQGRDDLLEDAVTAAVCISGAYDLEPVMLSARSSYVTLSESEAHELSPIHHVARLQCSILLAYADGDTDEFQRQSRAFAAALERVDRLTDVVRCLPGLNHFEIVETLCEPDSILVRAIVDRLIPVDTGCR